MIRQIKTKLGPRQPLSLGQKIWLMLQGRDLLQQRNDAIKTTFDLKLIGLKPLIGLLIRQRVKILRPGQGRATEIDRCTRLGLTTSDPTGLLLHSGTTLIGLGAHTTSRHGTVGKLGGLARGGQRLPAVQR